MWLLATSHVLAVVEQTQQFLRHVVVDVLEERIGVVLEIVFLCDGTST